MPNIYWRDIKKNQRVKRKVSFDPATKRSLTTFKVGNKTVFWNGSEASEAQEFLDKRSK